MSDHRSDAFVLTQQAVAGAKEWDFGLMSDGYMIWGGHSYTVKGGCPCCGTTIKDLTDLKSLAVVRAEASRDRLRAKLLLRRAEIKDTIPVPLSLADHLVDALTAIGDTARAEELLAAIREKKNPAG
jgi:hypothetical protein